MLVGESCVAPQCISGSFYCTSESSDTFGLIQRVTAWKSDIEVILPHRVHYLGHTHLAASVVSPRFRIADILDMHGHTPPDISMYGVRGRRRWCRQLCRAPSALCFFLPQSEYSPRPATSFVYYTVVEFSQLRTVPAVGGSYEITRDTLQLVYCMAAAYRAFLKDCPGHPRIHRPCSGCGCG